jgi:hypothetical protein
VYSTLFLVIVMRKKGVLMSWRLNGYGMIAVQQELFFLHRKNIADGSEPTVGCLIEFEVAPPFGTGKFAQAVNAVILPAEVRQ